jgi:hypothetical protein
LVQIVLQFKEVVHNTYQVAVKDECSASKCSRSTTIATILFRISPSLNPQPSAGRNLISKLLASLYRQGEGITQYNSLWSSGEKKAATKKKFVNDDYARSTITPGAMLV